MMVWSSSCFSILGQDNLNEPQLDGKKSYFYTQAKKALDKYKYIEADLFLDSAILSAKDEDKDSSIATLYVEKGNVKKYLNDYGVALDYLFKAMRIFEKNGNDESLVNTYTDIAEFYRRTQDYATAEQFIEKAKNKYDDAQLDDLRKLNKIYHRSAAIHNEFNPDPKFSLNASFKALALAKKIGDSNLMAISYNELGFTYKNLVKIDSSDYYYKEAERLWMDAENYQSALHAMANRAQLYKHNNVRLAEVPVIYERIIFLSDSLNARYSLMNVSWQLYTIYLEQKDTTNAYRYFRLYHDETMKVYNSKTKKELYNVNAKFQNEKIQDEYKLVEAALDQSSKNLAQKREQQVYLITVLIFAFLLLIMIAFLVLKLRNSNKILAVKNDEKDSLIQEIHHRVKNNLQFISSLINMQVKNTDNPAENQALNETSRRINAMALVHEMLYNSVEEKGISVKYYIEELIDSLNAMINSEKQNIEIEMELEEVELNVSDTISVGIITSELISNSMKYAFDGVENPSINIHLTKDGQGGFNYRIVDNGVGTDKDLQKDRSLGLRLVDIFSRQLKGTYTLDGSNGFSYTLNFKMK
jgi:two-component sensor histidine kinase